MKMASRTTHRMSTAFFSSKGNDLNTSRFETDGLRFFANKKEYKKGPNNILDIWKEYNLGTVSNIVLRAM